MLRNYLRVALRSLRKQKGYAAINVLGLAVGIAGALLVGLFVRYELAFDRFHAHGERIYRAWAHEATESEDYTNTMTPRPLGPAMLAALPEIEAMTRFEPRTGTLRRGPDAFSERVALVDSSFLDVFSFPVVAGDRTTALRRPDAVVLTDSAAARLFDDADPLGQPVTVRLRDREAEVTVAAVVRVPAASSIRFDALLPFALGETAFLPPGAMTQWFAISGETYVLLREGAGAGAVEAKLPDLLAGARPPDAEGTYTVGLQRLLDVHLDTSLPAGTATVRDPRTLWILAGIAALVLLIACINFTTLALGRSLERAREVGVRKALGAYRAQLMGQFWSEAALLTAVAMGAGVGLALLSRPLFRELAEQPLPVHPDGGTIALLAAVALVVALVAGAYPALVLSRFQPTEALRGRLRLGTGGGLQRGLVALQFALSIGLVASTFVMVAQLRFLQRANLGFEADRLLTIENVVPGMDSLAALAPLRGALEAEPTVAAVTGAALPLGAWGWAGYVPEGGGPQQTLRFNAVAPDFLEAMRIPLAAGPGFAAEPAVAARQAVVNRAYVERFALGDDPVGRPLQAPLDHYTVAGVTNDFHFQSLREAVEPAVLVTEVDSLMAAVSSIGIFASPSMDVLVRLGPGPLPDAVAAVERAFRSVAPDRPFDPRFVDEALDRQYREEARLGRIVSVAALLAVFVAALGLFGLAALTAAQRTKEIGVRRVLGASAAGIVGLLSRDLARLVVAGFAVAVPAAWWLMGRWLEDFAYRVDLGPGAFLAAGAIALAVAVAATTVHALRAATADPVKALRSE